jgi:hypothetical protein
MPSHDQRSPSVVEPEPPYMRTTCRASSYAIECPLRAGGMAAVSFPGDVDPPPHAVLAMNAGMTMRVSSRVIGDGTLGSGGEDAVVVVAS